MPDVFLSYNRGDQIVARRFAEGLEGAGLTVWWDTALTPGEAYDKVTENALRTAKAVVVLWSKRSVESRWVRAEATLADRNGTLLPAMIEVCERPIMFELVQTYDLSGWKGGANDAVWRDFLSGVRRFVERGHASPSAKRPASAWVEAAAPDLPVLAILPFENQSSDPELQFFSDGVAEEIFTAMTRVSGIRVIGSTSSFSFRGERKGEAGRALGATHILDGSVRRGGARVRIGAHLTETASGHLLWSERYDRELADAFAVQDEIAGEAAKVLAAKLAPPKPKAQIDPQAYDLYLRAMAIRKSPDPPAQHKAIAYLRAAVGIEPTFARAQAALALASCQLVAEATLEGARPEAFDEAAALVHREATRALELDPADIEARVTLHTIEPIIDNWRAHDEAFDAANRAAPSDLPILLRRSRWLSSVGRSREGSALLRQGYELDPLSPTMMVMRAGQILNGEANPDLAYALLDKAIARAPLDPFVWRRRYILLAYSSQWDEAGKLLNGSMPIPPGVSPERVALYASFLDVQRIVAGNLARTSDLSASNAMPIFVTLFSNPAEYLEGTRDLPERVIKPFREAALAQVKRWPFTVASVITLLTTTGLMNEAFDLLEETMRTTPRQKLWSQWNAEAIAGAGTDVLFFPTTRRSPRMLPLCARLGLCGYWAETGRWPDFIVDAPNRAELEAQAKRLAAPNV